MANLGAFQNVFTANADFDFQPPPGSLNRDNVFTSYFHGTFGSGTITFKGSMDGTNYVNLPVNPPDGTIINIAAGIITVRARFPQYRASLTGATTPSITLTVSG